MTHRIRKSMLNLHIVEREEVFHDVKPKSLWSKLQESVDGALSAGAAGKTESKGPVLHPLWEFNEVSPGCYCAHFTVRTRRGVTGFSLNSLTVLHRLISPLRQPVEGVREGGSSLQELPAGFPRNLPTASRRQRLDREVACLESARSVQPELPQICRYSARC